MTFCIRAQHVQYQKGHIVCVFIKEIYMILSYNVVKLTKCQSVNKQLVQCVCSITRISYVTISLAIWSSKHLMKCWGTMLRHSDTSLWLLASVVTMTTSSCITLDNGTIPFLWMKVIILAISVDISSCQSPSTYITTICFWTTVNYVQ